MVSDKKLIRKIDITIDQNAKTTLSRVIRSLYNSKCIDFFFQQENDKLVFFSRTKQGQLVRHPNISFDRNVYNKHFTRGNQADKNQLFHFIRSLEKDLSTGLI